MHIVFFTLSREVKEPLELENHRIQHCPFLHELQHIRAKQGSRGIATGREHDKADTLRASLLPSRLHPSTAVLSLVGSAHQSRS
jgi:hypothetical protein